MYRMTDRCWSGDGTRSGSIKAKPDCIECMFRQALNTVRMVTGDEETHFRVMSELARRVAGASVDRTPAALSKPVYEVVSEVTGVTDPYRREREETNAAALKLLPELRSIIGAAEDELDGVLHAAVAGNIIDLGIGHDFDLEKDVVELMSARFARNEIEQFRRELDRSVISLFWGTTRAR